LPTIKHYIIANLKELIETGVIRTDLLPSKDHITEKLCEDCFSLLMGARTISELDLLLLHIIEPVTAMDGLERLKAGDDSDDQD